jgi:hypothetical protein
MVELTEEIVMVVDLTVMEAVVAELEEMVKMGDQAITVETVELHTGNLI